MSISVAGNSDRQKTQTELEMEAGQKAVERRHTAQLAGVVTPDGDPGRRPELRTSRS